MANGQVTTSGQGSVVKGVSIALLGLALTASIGTLTASGGDGVVALTGQASTSAQGSVVQSAAKVLTGQSITTAQGTVYGTGRSLLQSATGTAIPLSTIVLVGQVTTSGHGLVTPNADGTVPLIGTEIVTATGTILTPNSVPLSGSASTSAAGTLGLTLRPTDIVGQVSTGAQGILTVLANDVTVNITGEDILSATGFVNATPILTGQVSTSAAGLLVSNLDVALLGQSSTAGQGSMTVDQGASEDTFIQSASGAASLTITVPLTGAVSTGSTGTIGLTNNVFQALTGDATTSASGTLIFTIEQPLIGLAVVTEQGVFGAPGFADLVGQVLTTGHGTLSVTEDRTQALTGQAATIAAGSVGLVMASSLSGQVDSVLPGQLGRSGGNMQFVLTGHSATGITGTLGVIGAAVLPPGVSNEGCSIVSAVEKETESSPSGHGAEGCFIQSGTAKEV